MADEQDTIFLDSINEKVSASLLNMKAQAMQHGLIVESLGFQAGKTSTAKDGRKRGQ